MSAQPGQLALAERTFRAATINDAWLAEAYQTSSAVAARTQLAFGESKLAVVWAHTHVSSLGSGVDALMTGMASYGKKNVGLIRLVTRVTRGSMMWHTNMNKSPPTYWMRFFFLANSNPKRDALKDTPSSCYDVLRRTRTHYELVRRTTTY